MNWIIQRSEAMLQTQQVEELISMVAGLDRQTIIGQFQTFQGSFPIDFTSEFLCHTPLERLRHLFVALCLQQQRMPEIIAASEAV
jgi:hypothetical protein